MFKSNCLNKVMNKIFMSKQLYLNFLFCLINLQLITSIKYPVFNNISTSEFDHIQSILIKSKEQFLDYILNQKYVISLTQFTLYEKEPEILSVFDKVSSYKILNDWNFHKIQCYEENDLCNLLSSNIQNKYLPSIKIYIKSQEIKTSSNIINKFSVSDLLEFLLKLSSNPIIEIKNNDINSFYEKYTKYSPIIYYVQKNTEFISCINLLSKKKYFEYFYFGIYAMNNTELKTKKEKIFFDNEKMPISKTWERDCDEIDEFLEQNKYPLLSKVDNKLLQQLSKDQKVLVVLIGYISLNDMIIKFINNEFKKLAYAHKNPDTVFAFDFNNELTNDNYLVNKTGFKFVSSDINTMKLLFYNFSNELYYKHLLPYKLNSTNAESIYERINFLLENINKLPFTCGSLWQDIVRTNKIFKFISDKKKWIALGFTIALMLLSIIVLYFYG